jgi:hypothetical protein
VFQNILSNKVGIRFNSLDHKSGIFVAIYGWIWNINVICSDLFFCWSLACTGGIVPNHAAELTAGYYNLDDRWLQNRSTHANKALCLHELHMCRDEGQ